MNALWNSSEVGLTEQESNLCGAPGTGSIFVALLVCNGEGGQLYANALAAVMEVNREGIVAAGLTGENCGYLAGLYHSRLYWQLQRLFSIVAQ